MARKATVWLSPTPQTPPVSEEARHEMGVLLLLVQRGETLAAPRSKPMSTIGRRVHELRVREGKSRLTWRLVYRIDDDAIVVAHWWAKKTQQTAKGDLEICRARFAAYDRAQRQQDED